MTEIEELKAKIEELNKQFADLLQKQEIKEEELGGKIWKPTKGNEYYAINWDASICATRYYNFCIDENIVNYGNYFDNEEQARKQAEFNKVYNRFRKYVEAYSEPLNWNDKDQKKYYMYYNYNGAHLLYANVSFYNEIAFQIYASSEQVLRDAIIYSAGSEKEFARIVFGVEE